MVAEIFHFWYFEVISMSNNLEFWLGHLEAKVLNLRRSNQCCWCIPTCIYGCHLPLKVAFISSNFNLRFGPLNLSLKLEKDPISSNLNSIISRIHSQGQSCFIINENSVYWARFQQRNPGNINFISQLLNFIWSWYNQIFHIIF